MHKFLMKALFGLSVVAGGVAVATPAHAMKLVNLSTGFCLGTAAGAVSNGTPIIVWACDGSANQQWNRGAAYPTLGKTASSFQYNTSAQPSSCLGVAAASTSDGAAIVLWSCVAPGPDQFWDAVKDASTGCYVFHDKNSGLVLGVSAGSIQEGAKTIQWDDLHTTPGHRDQEWCEQ
jgi:hypothetical protein